MTDDGARAVADQVGDGLRDAFAALASAAISPEQRATFQRRLLAITTTAKRDVVRAHEQLRRLHDDLHAAQTNISSSQDE
jgi:hypothetical protein